MPDVPLFFGRLTFEPGVIQAVDQYLVGGAMSGDRLHIGRRHVHHR